jgi:hypothetical protein
VLTPTEAPPPTRRRRCSRRRGRRGRRGQASDRFGPIHHHGDGGLTAPPGGVTRFGPTRRRRASTIR